MDDTSSYANVLKMIYPGKSKRYAKHLHTYLLILLTSMLQAREHQ